jgi:putative ABC transport system ATP-binding protein
MTETAIQVQGVSKRYGALEVLKAVDLSVPTGCFAAVIGKSGSGKSTLLGVISGLEKADNGDIILEGESLSGRDEAKTAELRRRTIGFVFQNFNLIPSLSALDNVLLPTFFNGKDAAANRKRAVSLLEQVGLGDRLDHRPSQLSGGEQQRVAIARALVGDPRILLADEPTGNLDAETGADVLGLLLDMTRINGATLLIVTHDLDIATKADMKIEMKDGRVLNDHA